MKIIDEIEETIKTDYRLGYLPKEDHIEEEWITEFKLKCFLDRLEAEKELKLAQKRINEYHRKHK